MRALFVMLCFSVCTACQKDTEPSIPYFQFDEVGRHLLSGLRPNDSIHFKGSNGSERHFRIFEMETKKIDVEACNWNTGHCRTFFSFDFLQIFFIRTDSATTAPGGPITSSLIKQMQLPADADEHNLPHDIQAKAHVYGGFVDFNAIPKAEPGGMSPFIPYPDFYQPLDLISFSNGVKTYNEVVVIKSGNNTVYTDPLYGKRYTVNEVWFDKAYGIVFFKDVFGNSWSRTN